MTAIPKPDVSLLATFEQLDALTRDTLADIKNHLHLGLAALMLGEDKAGHSTMSGEQIVACLEAAGVRLEKAQIVKAFKRADDRISRKTIDDETQYKLMTAGRREVEPLLNVGTIGVSFVEAGRPRTARKNLQDLFSGLTGTIRLCDPYYGVRSLDVLEMIPLPCSVRFLTSRPTENEAKIKVAIGYFKTEHPNTEFRVYPPPAPMHDRYLLSGDVLLLLGHGITDIGNKESFVVNISKEYAGDLIQELATSFDAKWAKASTL
jgi:hypothetical protein